MEIRLDGVWFAFDVIVFDFENENKPGYTGYDMHLDISDTWDGNKA
jgi:hypothetical protein